MQTSRRRQGRGPPHGRSRIEEESPARKLDLKDFAVLYRTNAQSRVDRRRPAPDGIPYVIVGGVAFYKRKEIKDILAYLKLIANPRDNESLLRIINVPARGIGETTIRKLTGFCARTAAPAPAVDQGAPAWPTSSRTGRSKRSGSFATMIKKYIALKEEMSVSELARALVDEIGILHELKEENTPKPARAPENIQELVSALSGILREPRRAPRSNISWRRSRWSPMSTRPICRAMR